MTKIFAKLTVLMLAGMLFFAIGCKSSVNNPTQSAQKYDRISSINRMLLQNDIERFLLLDRPSRLTRWHIVAD